MSPDEIAAAEADPEGAIELLADESGEGASSGRMLDLDKSWDAIRILLSGPAPDDPLTAGLAILGGRDIGDDAGYGPAALLDPDLVTEVSAALDGLSDEELASVYRDQVQDRPDVYPTGVFGADEFDTYVLPNIQDLRAFYRAVATAGEAVLVGML